MARKTIEVDTIKDKINLQLATPWISQDEKKILCSLLEFILMDTKNYIGYDYIEWRNGGSKKWQEAGCPEELSEKSKFFGPEYNRFYL